VRNVEYAETIVAIDVETGYANAYLNVVLLDAISDCVKHAQLYARYVMLMGCCAHPGSRCGYDHKCFGCNLFTCHDCKDKDDNTYRGICADCLYGRRANPKQPSGKKAKV
jgi:hypothetical protein